MVALKGKNSTQAKLELKSEVCDGKITLTLPIRTVSEANNFDHWTKKDKRHKLQQRTVAMILKPIKNKVTLPCHIKITRIGKRKLDKWDNLPMSVKYILDAVCAIITGNFVAGRADDDERITVSYDQFITNEYGVIIEITNL